VRRAGRWHGIGVEVRLDGGQSILSRCNIWHVRKRGLRQSKTQALIRKEEEGSVFENRPAESTSKIVLPFLRLWEWGGVSVAVEPVVRVQYVVAEIIEK